ncbi:MAG: hypothetical protein H0V44_09575, partial [Planctomycetes bacterium]|nr:hypothetical protein [Planctomycetota bacterium]
YSLDRDTKISQLQIGDAVCYRVAVGESAQSNGFGFVAALPGDTVSLAKGMLQVNGAPSKYSGPTNLADSGPLMVPQNHVYVVTSTHLTDSVVKGPLPAAALRGRIAEFP